MTWTERCVGNPVLRAQQEERLLAFHALHHHVYERAQKLLATVDGTDVQIGLAGKEREASAVVGVCLGDDPGVGAARATISTKAVDASVLATRSAWIGNATTTSGVSTKSQLVSVAMQTNNALRVSS